MPNFFAAITSFWLITMPADPLQKEGLTDHQFERYAVEHHCSQVDSKMWVCQEPGQFKTYLWVNRD